MNANDFQTDPMPLAPMVENGGTLQRLQTQYATAITVQKPRSLPVIEKGVAEEAALIGEDGFYAWGVGKNRIEGPSVELAMMIARHWGNAVIEMLPVQESRDAWVFTAAFVDLEAGLTVQRQFRQSKKWKVYGKFDEERKDDIRFQIGQSKAMRNAILRSVPSWLINRALDIAKGGVREAMQKRIGETCFEEVQDSALLALSELGVTEEDVLRVFDRPTKRALTLEDLVILSGNIRALKTGSETKDVLFPPESPPGREHGTLDAAELKAGTEENRGHGDERLGELGRSSKRRSKSGTVPIGTAPIGEKGESDRA